jgi:hypothetical protein
VHYGDDASSSSWCKSMWNPEMDIMKIRWPVKTTASFQR